MTHKGEGVRANRARQRRIGILLAALFAGVLGVDLILFAVATPGPPGTPSLPPFWAAMASLLFVLLLGFGSWKYYKVIDEVGQHDNLVACTLGFFFHLMAFIPWMLLAQAHVLPPPNATILFFSSVAVATLALPLIKLLR